MTKKYWFWILAFASIQLAAIIYLFNFASSEPGLYNLPKWIYHFLVIELAYCGLVYLFIKQFWK